MQKNTITNKITPCCNLPFSQMFWWVSNLNLNTEADREFIISKMSQSGTISVDAWKVLINSGELESDSALTKAEFLAWFDCNRQPSCEQLKLLIEGFKLGNYNPSDEYGVGWTEISNYEEYNDEVIKKVINYVGGVGSIPTALSDNIGKYYAADGTFTTNKALATNFKPTGSFVISPTFNPTTEIEAQGGKQISEYLFDANSLDQTIENIPTSATSFGTSGNIRGWGFPIGKAQRIKALVFKMIFPAGNTATSLKVRIRENNKDGVLVVQKIFSGLSLSGTIEYTANFDSLIDNADNLNYWVEIYADASFGIFRVNPAAYFTQVAGFPFVLTTTATDFGDTQVGTGSAASSYYDIYHKIIIETYTYKIKPALIPSDENEEIGKVYPNENERISLTGSSVTWGDGYLQAGYVKNLIERLQDRSDVVLPAQIGVGTDVLNRKYFKGTVRNLVLNDEFTFDLTGNELSIVQSIERSNTNASEIELYVDGVLYDTFNNFNPSEIGTGSKTFTADGTGVYFDLGRAFTFNHTVTLNGSPLVVTHNITQGTGFTIPSGSDCAIIRKIGVRSDGTSNVNHCLWMKNTPVSGASIVVNFSYGEEINYEKSTIGKDTAGNNESPYGDGTVSFDTTNPSTMASGLDFRETDERAVKTWRFTEFKKRTFRLKVKGLFTGATGTPYFRFNFATNRIFYFQNAGIGGWDLWDFDVDISVDNTRNWQRVVAFRPDKLVIETTPNDDWIVKGHKLSNPQTVTLAELRTIKNLPLKSIVYNSGNDNYTITRYKGVITAISETSVTFLGTVETAIEQGDVVQIGQYYSNNNDSVERVVDSISGNTIFFNNPIRKEEIIYPSLQDFVGKEVNVRSLSTFKTKLQGIITKIQNVLPLVKINLLENPMPNVLARELWGYWYIMDSLEKENINVKSVNYDSLRTWQKSQRKTTVSIALSTLTLDSVIGKKTRYFGTAGQNLVLSDVKQNGKSVYGKIVIENGWAYVVNQTTTGTGLNKGSSSATNSGQVYNGKQPRIIQLDDTLAGTISVEYSTQVWSTDSCHMNNEYGPELYADFLNDVLK